MNEKLVLALIIGLTIFGLLGWTFYQFRPKPGTQVADLGRTHVQVGSQVEYNSNPPTSGPHYEEWVKVGIYDRPQDDRYLIHSLEHGYIVISYNCAYKESSFIRAVSAHGIEELDATPSIAGLKTATEDASASAKMGDKFRSDECHTLVDQLTKVFEDRGKKKAIITPRPGLDARIALTAWNYLDKFNPSASSGLSVSDENRMKRFIDAHRDQGPEKTME